MIKNIIQSIIIVGLIAFSLLFNCDKDISDDMDIVATIGTRRIDWKHLQTSFELTPKWGKGLTYKQAYQNQLDFLIDEKLFAQAAIDAGLHNTPKIAQYLDFIQKKEMIKELYRQQVSSKVFISEAEYKAAYLKMKKKDQFNYIFSHSQENAHIYQKLMETNPFDEINLIDQKNDGKGRSPLFGFGDMQQELEDVVFDLEKGDVSHPIELENGYMVVQIMDGSTEKFISEREFAEMRSKIEKVIYQRKARKAANVFIKELMLDKDLTLNPSIFYALSDQLSFIIQDKVTDTPLPIFVSDQEINTARRSVSDILDEVLVTHRDGEMTVRDFLDELMKMPVDLRPNVKMAIQLKNAIGVIIRNEYLSKQAKDLGLNNHPDVIHETTIQADEILSKAWLREYTDHQQKIKNVNVINHEFPQSQSNSGEVSALLNFQELRLYASDSLRKIYPVTVDTTLYHSLIIHPKDTIRFDPANIVVRELFN